MPSGDGIPAAAGSGFCPLAASFRWGAPATERSREPPGSWFLPFFSFFSLPDDGRLATGRNTPSGVSQEAEQSRASSDTRRPCIIFLAAGKDRQHGTAHWRGRHSGNPATKRGSIPPRSKRTAPWWGHGNADVRKTGSIPARPLLIHYSRFTRPPGA